MRRSQLIFYSFSKKINFSCNSNCDAQSVAIYCSKSLNIVPFIIAKFSVSVMYKLIPFYIRHRKFINRTGVGKDHLKTFLKTSPHYHICYSRCKWCTQILIQTLQKRKVTSSKLVALKNEADA